MSLCFILCLLNCIHQVCWVSFFVFFFERSHVTASKAAIKAITCACGDSDMEAEGKMLLHPTTKARCSTWEAESSKAVACDDSDTEAEGKMSLHAITKACSLLLWSWKKAVACDASDTEAEGHMFVACYHMPPHPPHMKLKGICRMWRFRYGGRRKNVVACNHKGSLAPPVKLKESRRMWRLQIRRQNIQYTVYEEQMWTLCCALCK